VLSVNFESDMQYGFDKSDYKDPDFDPSTRMQHGKIWLKVNRSDGSNGNKPIEWFLDPMKVVTVTK
jgi:hypothetical protein